MDEPAAGDDRGEGFLAPLDVAVNIMVDQNSYLEIIIFVYAIHDVRYFEYINTSVL